MTTDEAIKKLGILRDKFGLVLKDVPELCDTCVSALRAQQAAEKQECYIVIHHNYADGTDAYAFQTEEKAEASIRQDVDAVTAELEEQGYSPRRLLNLVGGEASVYVPDSDIYYEWQAVPSHVE